MKRTFIFANDLPNIELVFSLGLTQRFHPSLLLRHLHPPLPLVSFYHSILPSKDHHLPYLSIEAQVFLQVTFSRVLHHSVFFSFLLLRVLLPLVDFQYHRCLRVLHQHWIRSDGYFVVRSCYHYSGIGVNLMRRKKRTIRRRRLKYSKIRLFK